MLRHERRGWREAPLNLVGRILGAAALTMGLLVFAALFPGAEREGWRPAGQAQAVENGGGGWASLFPSLSTSVVLAGVALGLVAALAYWWNASLRRTRERLEQEVAKRTEEIERQKRQLTAYNRELLHTNEQLRRTVEEKSELLGVAAHDLKNPLFGIRALADIVLENEDLSDRVERKLTLIRESAAEAMTRIDDLMASAAGSAQAQVEMEPVDLTALAQWVVHSFAPHAQRKSQDLLCSVPEEACVVKGDKRKLREAIANLVSNALKYSPSGKAVDVRVTRTEEAVAVAVADEGPGLSAKDQERMFAPFQRLTPTPTGDESSSGLGLYIVKQIVDLHDGAIEVDSTPGDGSTFRMRFSAAEGKTDPVPETDPRELENVA